MFSTTKETVRTLDAVNSSEPHWKISHKNFKWVSESGSEVEYSGNALISREDQRHSIEFELLTSILGSAEIQIPILITSGATVRLFVDGKLVDTLLLHVSDGQVETLHQITKNVTNFVAQKAITRLGIEITYPSQAAIAIFPLGDGQQELRPLLRQQKRLSDGIPTVMFFIAAWGVVTGGTMWFSTFFLKFAELKSHLILAVSSPIIVWLITSILKFDIKNVEVKPALRKTYALVKPRLSLFLVFIWGAFFVVSYLAGKAFYCLYIRHDYSELIQKALDKESSPEQDDLICRAFVKAPWRKEAQILFERRAYNLRNLSGMAAFKEHVFKFISAPEVNRAIISEQGTGGPPFYLSGTASSAVNDPVTWYATLLPEAEKDGERILRDKAVTLLASKQSLEALLYRLNFQIGLLYSDRVKYYKSQQPELRLKAEMEQEKMSEQLRAIIAPENGNYAAISHLHAFQVACDVLACQELTKCQSQRAEKWFDLEMQVREKQQIGKEKPTWLRPAEKLMLYHMFVTQGGVNVNPGDAAAKNASDLLHICPGFNQRFNDYFLKAYSKYTSREIWREGTILDNKAVSYVKTLLNIDWRN